MKKYTSIDEIAETLGLKPFEQFERESQESFITSHPNYKYDSLCRTGRTTKGLLKLILKMQQRQGEYQTILIVGWSDFYAKELRRQLADLLVTLNLEELLTNITVKTASCDWFEKEQLSRGFNGLVFVDHFYRVKR